ncbi:uncharacterized protein ocm [Chironomus tepperi]|uniref:uncharacterized protein ocm n=1 Tax=Chironomus tepperi TaxID=113505 RepID=UPI00391F53C0
MDAYQSYVNIDEEDLLDELPERRASFCKSDKISLCESNRDDSGLGISDSIEIFKESVEHQFLEELSCETNDVNTELDSKLPELIPLSNISHSPNDKPTTNSVNTTPNKNSLPELQPIPIMIMDERKNSFSDGISNKEMNNESRRSSTSSFIDSLLDKLRRNNSESSASDISPKKVTSEYKSSDDDLLVEMTRPVSFTKSENPNMLPTPVVENQSISSVFVNSAKEYEEAIERNKKIVCNKHEDKSKMSSKSQPPQMKPPKLPSNFKHPRTLAQKRLLLASNISFLMIEQESKIFKQIQRKKSNKEVDYQFIDDLSEDEIPLKHGPWKALSWLKTEEGNYIQQYINIDGQSYKLTGSKGNHKNKFLLPQSSKPFQKYQTTSLRSVRCCEGGKIKKRIIDNLVNVESIKKFILEGNLNPFKKLESNTLCNQLSLIKPRPLFKKIEQINRNRKLLENDEDSAFLGDYMKFKMPDIKLEVRPKNKVPLDSIAKQYLNEIIPYCDLNENWINFSLSALATKEDMKDVDEAFEFTIPYCDNKQNILVREIIKHKDYVDAQTNSENCEDFDEFKWTFAENCDKNDILEMEIVEIIKDLSNSVCINLNDDIFTKVDPLERTSLLVAPIKPKEALQEIASTSKNLKIDQSKKMLLELRRLNANVVKSDSTRVDDEEDIRRHALAHLAKDERDLRPTVIVTDSDTVLLSNKKTESRRQKRAPKRYSDYMQSVVIDGSEKEIAYEPPKKVKPKELIDEPFKTKAQLTDTGMTHEETKQLKEAIQKWIHVNVVIQKLEHLEDIQPWCMLHNLYKCSCKTIVPKEITRNEGISDDKLERLKEDIIEEPQNVLDKEELSTHKDSLNVSNNSPSEEFSADIEELKIEEVPSQENIENSRRVLPMESDKPRKNMLEIQEDIDLEEENKENAPKMEILNISELVNGGIGPIFINIYDTKVNRLNQIFRSILNNNMALVYLDGLGYYVDMKKIDVMKLKFDEIRDELEHPVFIIRPKNYKADEEQLKIYSDFVDLLFKDDTELLKQIKDKGLLREVARIIEIILQSVRKKIAAQIGDEPTDFVKEQLSLITRDRSNSNTSVSSADTSPLHFNGKQLEKAPPPGFETEMMKDFNRIFSMRMQKLCAIIRSNSLGLHPLDGYVNKFYIYKWNLLLQSFEEDLINIWQVKLNDDLGKNYYMYIITNTSTPPDIENADTENITNIKKLPLSNISALIKMILLRIENSKTMNMTVLLFGCKGYFRICGLLNSKENYFDGVSAKPTKQTHPRLTAKIQKVYNIWYGLKKASALKIMSNEQDSINDQEVKDDREKIVSNKPNVHADEANDNKSKDQTMQPSTYKWFLFNISNDFSDIYIKQWKNYLPYRVIMSAISQARSKQRTIRILGPLNSAKDTPRIFALPNAPLKFKKEEGQNMTGNFLLFGPYLRDSNSNLLLMQKVDGRMILRDDYEQQNNIKRSSRTRCLWIYANSLKCVTDSQIESIQPSWLKKGDRTNQGTENNENSPDYIKQKVPKLHSDDSRKKFKISSTSNGLKKVL